MFELATPWVLALLPLPLILWYLVPPAPIKQLAALKVPFFAAMQHIVKDEQRSIAGQTSLIIPAFIWLFLIAALAGPRWIGEPLPLQREGYNMMMALDLSGSMEINDMILNGRPVSRLAVVKKAAKQFVEDRKGDRIGLILFGTQAYLQTPLTYDRQSVLMRLDDATVGLAGKTTSIGDAVGLAVKRLEEVPKEGRVIILLTDGVNNSGVLAPLKAAELAKEDDIKIYTIGLGAESDPSAVTPEHFINFNGSADLDEATLEEMSKMTGGQYFRATDHDSLHEIYQTINQLEKIKQEHASIRPQKEYYPWFIFLALISGFGWILTNTGVLRKLKPWSMQQEGVR
jgi:Ca-activated chloride channel family protein